MLDDAAVLERETEDTVQGSIPDVLEQARQVVNQPQEIERPKLRTFAEILTDRKPEERDIRSFAKPYLDRLRDAQKTFQKNVIEDRQKAEHFFEDVVNIICQQAQREFTQSVLDPHDPAKVELSDEEQSALLGLGFVFLEQDKLLSSLTEFDQDTARKGILETLLAIQKSLTRRRKDPQVLPAMASQYFGTLD